MKNNNDVAEFGKIRSILWPVHVFELQKFVPMFLMFFFVNINYSLLRIVKDSLIINAPGSGAEALPFLKLWCTTPAAIIFMAIYVKLSTIVDRKKLFYISLSPFLFFFLIFTYVISPNVDTLHPTVSADWLQNILPLGLNGFVALYRNWSYSLFYVLAELWGSVVLSTLYWGLANEISQVGEAKRFYGLLSIGANMALIFVAPITKYANKIGNWEESLNFIMVLIIFSCLLITGLYWYINNMVMTKDQFKVVEPVANLKKKKIKLSFKQSLLELTKSKYLALLAVIVLAYGISINLVEVTWKHNLKVLFDGNKKDFLDFQGMMMTYTGLFTIFFLYFGTANVFRKFGWKIAAMITPVVLLTTSIIFFANLSFADLFTGILVTMESLTPLLVVAWVGGAQNILSKSCKYSFFDPSKEMAYIPLSSHTRRIGKAAIDGVGGRLGKSGGAAINMLLITLLGSISYITPYVAVITIGTAILWLVCIYYLNRRFVKLTN